MTLHSANSFPNDARGSWLELVGYFVKPSLKVQADILIPKEFDPTGFKPWLDCLFDGDAERQPCRNDPRGLGTRTRAYLNSFLELTRLFLELGRMPVFDSLELLSVEASGDSADRFSVQISAPCVNLMPKAAYELSLKAALEVCQWVSQNPFNPANRDTLFNSIDQRVIAELHKIIPAGKSTIPVLKVAHALGIPFIHLGIGVYQLGFGSKSKRLDRSALDTDSAVGARLAQNKFSTANLLRLAGLPAPVHQLATNYSEALAIAQQLGFPLVVKPVDRDRGEGVTVDVWDSNSLKTAFEKALDLSQLKQVIVERQVTGVCHRLFIANDGLLYAVKRLPMSVRADGKSTVQQLVNNALARELLSPPWRRSELKPLDALALISLQMVGLTAESIPQAGVLVPLRRIESTEWGGVDEDVTQQVHPENLRVALEAAGQFGLHTAGIDIISPDIAQPWHKNGAIINEVNFAPLLGGAEISRSYLPRFLSELMEGQGVIPIINVDIESTALTEQQSRVRSGERCFVLSATRLIDPTGVDLSMPLRSAEERLLAVLCRRDVDSLVIINSASQAMPPNVAASLPAGPL